MVSDAFHTSGGVDNVDAGAFGDGFGGAFRQAGAAGNAIVLNFHCHGIKVGGQAVLGRQDASPTPWLTERHGYDPTC